MIKKCAINIVLIEPEIPQNTGNIGRTCVGLGARLIIVGKPGFSLEDKDIKRAGLDYWPKLLMERFESWGMFEKSLSPEADVKVFSTRGKTSFWDVEYRAPLYLVFGSESRGLPPSLYRHLSDKLLRIPHGKDIRSLNLSNAVGIAAYEAVRRLRSIVN
ncbi:MAG: tRNA (cytidine(34)-2'-O)-methyltransferase [Elusimicrobia bacterium]|nr:tRNA (cytidine(34)-2'-O)-methyltransferase [Candidatus Obscuribacterium magneticum]